MSLAYAPIFAQPPARFGSLVSAHVYRRKKANNERGRDQEAQRIPGTCTRDLRVAESARRWRAIVGMGVEDEQLIESDINVCNLNASNRVSHRN